MTRHALHPFLDDKGYVLLDGGLSAELEAHGHDLNHPLWSARLLADEPEAIVRAHRAFLEAGADCIISASYQATPQGLVEHGASKREARELIRRSYRIAREACEAFPVAGSRQRPIAAASIGPYGAYVTGGAEYRGDYGRSERQLVDFHRERFELLADEAPLLAIETIPSFIEAQALRSLLRERPACRAWISFSCRDGQHISDGHRIDEAAALFDGLDQVVAVGLNCTSPANVAPLIEQLAHRPYAKPIIAYPNSGERYCAEDRTWDQDASSASIEALAPDWRHLGARLLGGCCRVAAPELTRIAAALHAAPRDR